MTTNDLPTSIRRLEGEDAERLVRLTGAYDDLQTVLRCCERLVGMFDGQHEDVEIEALWTLALLSYARVFAAGPGGAALTEDDLVESATAANTAADAATDAATADDSPQRPTVDADKVREWHRVVMHLRDHHADPVVNPRETFTAGIAFDPDNGVTAIAVSSVRSPAVDEAAVRQAGGLAYPLIGVLDGRIEPLQQRIFERVRDLPRTQLDKLEEIPVAATP